MGEPGVRCDMCSSGSRVHLQFVSALCTGKRTKMATAFSIDPFLETVDMIVMFLVDGVVTGVHNYDPEGRRHESGDLVHIIRNTPSGSQEADSDVCCDVTEKPGELAVILGWGETYDEAVQMSKNYVSRVAKWHGDNGVELNVFGHDLSQTQILQ